MQHGNGSRKKVGKWNKELEKGKREDTKAKSKNFVGGKRAGNTVSQLSESHFPFQLSYTHTCTQSHTTHPTKVRSQKSTNYNSPH